MSKKRYLPYGYHIQDGQVVPEPEQACIVYHIFERYAQGNTLQEIADDLIAKSVAYRDDKAAWNKNVIHHILQNETYLGTDSYEAIITPELFDRARMARQSRSNTYSEKLRAVRKDVICAYCGSKMYWKASDKQWFCNSCGIRTPRTTPEVTIRQVADKMRLLQQEPQRIQFPSNGGQIFNLELAKLTREIDRKIEREPQEIEEILALILRRASLQFDLLPMGTADPMTHKLQKVYGEHTPIVSFDEALYKETVEKIVMSRDGQISLQLINGQII